jgi:hypothetical protein
MLKALGLAAALAIATAASYATPLQASLRAPIITADSDVMTIAAKKKKKAKAKRCKGSKVYSKKKKRCVGKRKRMKKKK